MNHKWGQPVSFTFKTERSCIREGCTVVKVTVHQPGEIPWPEFWKDGERVPGTRTPPCVGMVGEAT